MTSFRNRAAAFALAATGGLIYAKQWDQLALVWACLVLLFILRVTQVPRH